MKNLIIFDCFGVIVSSMTPQWFAKRIKDPAECKRLKEYYMDPGDKGEKNIQEVANDVARDFHLDGKEVLNEWFSSVTLNQELIAYIQELRKDQNNVIILLSNAAEGVVEYVFNKFNLYPYFDKIFVSWKEKLIKPHFDFYLLAKNSFHEAFDHVVMIDDTLVNVNHLESIGIQGILYEDVASLKDKLERVI